MQELIRQQIERQVEELAESLVTSEGMELVDLVYRREGGRWVLRMFIDKEGGVTIKDCADISRQLGDLLDVNDFIPQAYVLEVSSPGLNRPLRKREDFSRFAGRKIEVRLNLALEGRKKIVGTLIGVEGNEVTVSAPECSYTISLENIARANLIYEF
jgi:ribosome maturation factor RimP